tara:strand:- start:187 stop:348 length:162 start_codon:yes stop_codon:yes gene_type:complete
VSKSIFLNRLSRALILKYSMRIGPTAGLKTLEIMEREKSWGRITYPGNYMRDI